MDERLEKALDFSNYMTTLNNQKRLLKEKYNDDLIHFFSGCQFTITRELITFCSTMLNLGQDTTVLIDDNGLPASIDNLEDFLEEIVEKYSSASNDYYSEYSNLKKNRKVEKLVGYEQD